MDPLQQLNLIPHMSNIRNYLKHLLEPICIILLIIILVAILRWSENSRFFENSPGINKIIEYPSPDESEIPDYSMVYPSPYIPSSLYPPTQEVKLRFIGPECLYDQINNITLYLGSGWYGFAPALETASIDIFNYNPEDTKYSHGKPLNLPDDNVKIEIYTLEVSETNTVEDWISNLVDTTELETSSLADLKTNISNYYPYKLGIYSGYAYDVVDSSGWNAKVIGLQMSESIALIINIFPADSSAFSQALAILSTLIISESNNCQIDIKNEN